MKIVGKWLARVIWPVFEPIIRWGVRFSIISGLVWLMFYAEFATPARVIVVDALTTVSSDLGKYIKGLVPKADETAKIARCAPVREQLAELVAYIADTFSESALKSGRSKAMMQGTIRGGSLGGGLDARSKYDAWWNAQLKDSKYRRMTIVRQIADSGC